MTETLLFQEISVENEQLIAGGKSPYDSLLDKIDINVDVDLNYSLNFNIENLYARSGDLIAIDGGQISGSSSGNNSIANVA